MKGMVDKHQLRSACILLINTVEIEVRAYLDQEEDNEFMERIASALQELDEARESSKTREWENEE
jgi:hypothetical protein